MSFSEKTSTDAGASIGCGIEGAMGRGRRPLQETMGAENNFSGPQIREIGLYGLRKVGGTGWGRESHCLPPRAGM